MGTKESFQNTIQSYCYAPSAIIVTRRQKGGGGAVELGV